MPVDLPSRRVWVNIPEATVVMLNDRQIENSARAIVGHPSRPTPVLSSRITSVVLNPPWFVPDTIAREDLMPRQQANPEFFTQKKIAVFSRASDKFTKVSAVQIDWSRGVQNNAKYLLRQAPGPWNSLGRYKFDFLNNYNVYLHDTPAPGLFSLDTRSLSSGCIRLEQPAVLAEWLVQPVASDVDALEGLTAKLADNRTHRLTFTNAVTLDVVYLLAWVDAGNGDIQFRQDIYRRLSPADPLASGFER